MQAQRIARRLAGDHAYGQRLHRPPSSLSDLAPRQAAKAKPPVDLA